MSRRPTLLATLVTTCVVVVTLAGCSGSSGGSSTPAGPTTSTPYVANPLEPGHGFVQIGGQRYDFDGVICAEGPLKSDPKNTVREFGVYANFTQAGSLYAVSLTRYEDHSVGAVPTVTDTALVRMQGVGEVKGLKAQRARVIGHDQWGDVYDPKATTELIVHTADRYEALGRYGSVDGNRENTKPGTTPQTGTAEGDVAMRCPSKSSTASTTTTSTTAGGYPATRRRPPRHRPRRRRPRRCPGWPTPPRWAGADSAPRPPLLPADSADGR